MPQLDHVSYFSQYLWLCVFFFIFYVALLKGFLPKMSRILKLRDAKTGGSTTGGFSDNEKESVNTAYQIVMNEGLSTAQSGLLSRFEQTEKWLDNEQAKANQKKFNKANKAYLKTLGSTSLGNQLVLAQLGVLNPPMPSSIEGAKKSLYTSRLIRTLKQMVKPVVKPTSKKSVKKVKKTKK